MANYQQSQAQPSNTYGQYFGYGSGMQYDSSSSQNKWGTGSNVGNQTQTPQSQNQQQIYQAAAQNYAAASGYYGNQQGYGQQQSYTGSVDNANMNGTRGTGNTSTNTGSKTLGSYQMTNPTSTTASSSNTIATSYSSGTLGSNTSSSGFGSNTSGFGLAASGFGSTTSGFGSSGNFSNNTSGNKSGMNNQNQMLGAAFGNMNQSSGINSSMNNSMANNMAVPATSQAQSFGGTATADALGQFNQMPQFFGAGANYGTFSSGDASGGNFAAGYNQQAMNAGMMSLLQQTLLQQANGGTASFGMGTGNTWGTSDGDGGFYAPPVDSSYQSGGDAKQGKKGKKWSGKDNKQDFYGNRFAQMFTGVPAIMGQPQTGAGKGKRLMDGVRFNVKGEKVIDVEIPLALYSRWGQLRKFFSRQDTEVAKHLIETHDQMCEECSEREHGKEKKRDQWTKPAERETVETAETAEPEEIELSEEDMALRQLMGFGNFNTTREAMGAEKKVDGLTTACTKSTASSSALESEAEFIGPQVPSGDESKPEKDEPVSLSEEEKLLMNKLGWSVFNKKDKDGQPIDDGDDDDENVERMDDGSKDGTAAGGQ
ncbi:hypothetical protein ACOMHN_000815 [Nucella lapillus]